MQLVGMLESNAADYLAGLGTTYYGTPPPEGSNPDYFLVSEVPVDWRNVRRKYAADRSLEDTYNASISYSSEVTEFPTFTRDYIVRRAVYTPRTKLSALAGIVNARVSAGGTGYDQATVSVSLSGGTGSGGVVKAIVSNGVVTMLVITAEGNYTVAPTVTINGGTGATGTVEVQPQTAILVKEDYIRTPDSDLDGLYVLVRRIYKTLPGPIVVEVRTDQESKLPILTSRQERASTDSFTEGELAPTSRAISSIVSNGDGTATITTTTKNYYSPLEYVSLAGTNSTPSIDGNQRVIRVTSDYAFVITAVITISGTTGTVQETNYFERDLLPTESNYVNIKVDTMPTVSQVSAFNEIDVPCWKDYALPDGLEAIKGYRELGTSSETSAGTTYSVSSSFTFSGGVGVQFKNGYRGPYEALRSRYFFSGQPSALPGSITPTIIQPSMGSVTVQGGAIAHRLSANVDGSSESTSFSFTYRNIGIPPCLTGAAPSVTIVGTGQATFTLDLPVSTPSHFTAGDLITLVDQTTKLRAGVWQVYVWVLTVPTNLP